jgi:transcriptional regulator with XRE-family HTH domain
MVRNLGEKITRIRILEDKTQLEMSEFLDVAQSSYSSWERLNVIPPFEAMKKLIELGKKHNIIFTVEDLLKNMKQRPAKSYRRGPKKTDIK